MRFYFHPDAEAEFDKAVAYYEEQQQGLGLELAREVYSTIARTMKFPIRLQSCRRILAVVS